MSILDVIILLVVVIGFIVFREVMCDHFSEFCTRRKVLSRLNDFRNQDVQTGDTGSSFRERILTKRIG